MGWIQWIGSEGGGFRVDQSATYRCIMADEKKVLLVEDDLEQGALLKNFLTTRQYDVTWVETAGAAMAHSQYPQFILLDLNLPDGDGISLFPLLKQKFPDSFLLMLTARKEEVDRILGLEIGADDYVTKPYSLRELEVRLRALIRRKRSIGPIIENESTPGFFLQENTCKAVNGVIQVEFTAQEFRVLTMLAKHPKRIFSREQLIDACWGNGIFVTDRVVDAMVARIRKKLKKSFGAPFIFTKHGLGYGFDPSP
jgi:DNA-binding response OmpR family regulator